MINVFRSIKNAVVKNTGLTTQLIPDKKYTKSDSNNKFFNKTPTDQSTICLKNMENISAKDASMY